MKREVVDAGLIPSQIKPKTKKTTVQLFGFNIQNQKKAHYELLKVACSKFDFNVMQWHIVSLQKFTLLSPKAVETRRINSNHQIRLSMMVLKLVLYLCSILKSLP